MSDELRDLGKRILRKPMIRLSVNNWRERLKSARERRRENWLGHEAAVRLRQFRPPYKLHVGCGQVRLEGWINIDANETLDTVDLVWDSTRRFPIPDHSCSMIYNEHFLEHLSVDEGLKFLRECHRMLAPKGVLRIAMPSLEVIVEKYASGDWHNQDWLTQPEYQFIQTRAEMLNVAMRYWEHQYVYDREELHRRLGEAGFSDIKDVELGESDVPELRRLETRPDSLLICEAWR